MISRSTPTTSHRYLVVGVVEFAGSKGFNVFLRGMQEFQVAFCVSSQTLPSRNLTTRPAKSMTR